MRFLSYVFLSVLILSIFTSTAAAERLAIVVARGPQSNGDNGFDESVYDVAGGINLSTNFFTTPFNIDIPRFPTNKAVVTPNNVLKFMAGTLPNVGYGEATPNILLAFDLVSGYLINGINTLSTFVGISSCANFNDPIYLAPNGDIGIWNLGASTLNPVLSLQSSLISGEVIRDSFHVNCQTGDIDFTGIRQLSGTIIATRIANRHLIGASSTIAEVFGSQTTTSFQGSFIRYFTRLPNGNIFGIVNSVQGGSFSSQAVFLNVTTNQVSIVNTLPANGLTTGGFASYGNKIFAPYYDLSSILNPNPTSTPYGISVSEVDPASGAPGPSNGTIINPFNSAFTDGQIVAIAAYP